MYRITSIESLIAERIKAIILANPAPENPEWLGRAPDTNTFYLTFQYITLAVALPKGHPVHTILAIVTIKGCLR
jgi:hypothetical protein